MTKTALITGGSKGIGYGIAESLVREGYRVGITSRNAAAAREAADRLNQIAPDHALALEADVRDFEAQQRSVQTLIDAWGRLDLLVANAGLGHFRSVLELTPDQWNETIETNLTGVFYSIKATAEALMKTEGLIVTIASLAGTNFFAGGAAYNASKFGLVGFTQAVMLDLRNKGVRVTTIMPGSVTSNFNGHVPDERDAWKIQPEDMGQMVVDLTRLNPRTLPSKIEVRPSRPPSSK